MSVVSPIDAAHIALRMRARGMTYVGISIAMDVAYGDARHPNVWRRTLRSMGAPAKPHGAPYRPATDFAARTPQTARTPSSRSARQPTEGRRAGLRFPSEVTEATG